MTQIPAFAFASVPRLHCAAGAASDLARHVREHFPAVRRPLIVTDGDLLAAGVHAALEHSLELAGLTVRTYGGVIANPPLAVLRHAVDFAHDHRADLVIGLGGGSSLDTAKLVAAMTLDPALLQRLDTPLPIGQRLPLILIPTTTSGAEASPAAMLTNDEGNKLAVQSAALMADLVLLDPRLTISLPPADTAASALQAMAHAIDACLHPGAHALIQASARQALQLLSTHVLAALDDAAHPAARQQLLIGGYLAGQAHANVPPSMLASLAEPLVTLFGIPYAQAVALLAPALLRTRLDQSTDLLAELSAIMTPHVQAPANTRAESLVVALQQLAKTAGLPTSLESIGAKPSDLERLSAEAVRQAELFQLAISAEMASQLYQSAL